MKKVFEFRQSDLLEAVTQYLKSMEEIDHTDELYIVHTMYHEESAQIGLCVSTYHKYIDKK